MIPGAIAYGMIGAGMDSLFAAQEIAYNACVASGDSTCRLHVSPRQLVTPQLLLAFAAIGCLALAPVALKRLSATRSTQLPNPRAADR